MFDILIIIYVIVCIALIVIVLLQSGKGDGLAGVFGAGGGSQTLFGSRTGDVLTKSTTALAVLFMLLSLVLAFLSGHRGRTISEEAEMIGRRMEGTLSGEESSPEEGKAAPEPVGPTSAPAE